MDIKPSVLIIEDHADVRQILRLQLQVEGYMVAAVGDCTAAFEFLKCYKPDVILADLSLPVMTGLEFIHRAKKDASLCIIPIIAMSAFDQKYLDAAMVAGADAVLRKPIEFATLVSAVQKAAAHKMPPDPSEVCIEASTTPASRRGFSGDSA